MMQQKTTQEKHDRAKYKLAASIKECMKTTPVDRITVKDIVDECGISRQSFYYHFQDILEVIEWSMEQAFGQLLDRSLQEDDPEIVLNDFIAASENAAPFMQKLFRSQKREQVEWLMARCVRSYLQELISAKGKLPRIPYEDLDIALNFCTYGFVGLLLECCDKKKTVDRETMARQMYRLLQGRIGEADPVRA